MSTWRKPKEGSKQLNKEQIERLYSVFDFSDGEVIERAWFEKYDDSDQEHLVVQYIDENGDEGNYEPELDADQMSFILSGWKRETFDQDDFDDFELRAAELGDDFDEDPYGSDEFDGHESLNEDKDNDDEKITFKKAYQFPKLSKDEEAKLPDYNLTIEAKFIKSDDYNTKGDVLVSGNEDDLRAFGDEVLGGYELHPDYLYDLDEFDFEDLEDSGMLKRLNGEDHDDDNDEDDDDHHEDDDEFDPDNDDIDLPKEWDLDWTEVSDLGITEATEDDEKKELLSDYLSDNFGFCHKGFKYEENDDGIHIYDIKWDTSESLKEAEEISTKKIIRFRNKENPKLTIDIELISEGENAGWDDWEIVNAPGSLVADDTIEIEGKNFVVHVDEYEQIVRLVPEELDDEFDDMDPENIPEGTVIFESLKEDTVKQNGKWVNKGKEGTHGKFDTKKEADAQRKAMFANGYHEDLNNNQLKNFIDYHKKYGYPVRELDDHVEIDVGEGPDNITLFIDKDGKVKEVGDSEDVGHIEKEHDSLEAYLDDVGFDENDKNTILGESVEDDLTEEKKKIYKVSMTDVSKKDEKELGIKGIIVTYDIPANSETEAKARARKFDPGKRIVKVEETSETIEEGLSEKDLVDNLVANGSCADEAEAKERVARMSNEEKQELSKSIQKQNQQNLLNDSLNEAQLKEGEYARIQGEIARAKQDLDNLKHSLQYAANEEEKERILDDIAWKEQEIGELEGALAEIRYVDNGNANDYSGYESLQEDKQEKDDLIQIYCYSKEPEVFKDRKLAIRKFKDCQANSEGAEQERYTNILMDLEDGFMICWDQVTNLPPEVEKEYNKQLEESCKGNRCKKDVDTLKEDDNNGEEKEGNKMNKFAIKNRLKTFDIQHYFSDMAISLVEEIIDRDDVNSIDDAYEYVTEAVDGSSMIYYAQCFNYIQEANITDFSEAIDEFGVKDITGIAMYYLDQEIYQLLGKLSSLMNDEDSEEEEEEK